VGPTAEGLFPQPSINRLAAIGEWMKTNSEAIYGTQASPFKHLSWGRCTQKSIEGGTRLYLHVFSWPANGRLVVPGLYSRPGRAFLLSDPTNELNVHREEDALIINTPDVAPNPINSVVVLDLVGNLDVNDPPMISAENDIFVDETNVSITSVRENIIIRYTLDGSMPSLKSLIVDGPIRLTNTARVSARVFREGKPVSGSIHAEYTKVVPNPDVKLNGIAQGLKYSYYEGSWDQLPDFNALKVVAAGVTSTFDIFLRKQSDYFGFQYEGFILLPEDGIYSFYTDSDDVKPTSIIKISVK
jgi:alpha-L-fucosidase